MSGAIYGHQLIIKIEKAIAWLTGIFTIVYLFFSFRISISRRFHPRPSGSFATFVGGIVLSMTMVGLGFLNYGGDYARYLPRKTLRAASFLDHHRHCSACFCAPSSSA